MSSLANGVPKYSIVSSPNTSIRRVVALLLAQKLES
tara:strand:+ start:463 stop:570 length:108 start_codon:yes stop_codon:yes gene_type:complete